MWSTKHLSGSSCSVDTGLFCDILWMGNFSIVWKCFTFYWDISKTVWIFVWFNFMLLCISFGSSSHQGGWLGKCSDLPCHLYGWWITTMNNKASLSGQWEWDNQMTLATKADRCLQRLLLQGGGHIHLGACYKGNWRSLWGQSLSFDGILALSS